MKLMLFSFERPLFLSLYLYTEEASLNKGRNTEKIDTLRIDLFSSTSKFEGGQGGG